MKKTIDWTDQTPESGEETKTNHIQQNTWPTILWTLAAEQQDESKEKIQLPNVIICRRYGSDRANDMAALETDLPEILNNITYINIPWKVVSYLKSDVKNIVFVGQYFDYDMKGTDVAAAVKKVGVDSEVILLTSIDMYPYQLWDCDHYYQTSKSFNVPDGARMIVDHLKSKIHVSTQKEQVPSSEDILEKKLELLHTCLVPSQVPTQLPKELSMYTEAFELFTQRTKECSDAFDDVYVEALSDFRDVLLENM
jgi:hypothetical protein